MTAACLTGGRVLTRCGGVAGLSTFVAVPCGIRPASVGWPGGAGPGETTGLGQFSGLLSAVDGLVYAVSCGAGRWLVRDETKDQRFRLRLASGP
jgi:hypothetical protein